MEHAKPHAQHLFCFQKMTDICPAVSSARGAPASFLQRTVIQFISGVKQVKFSMTGIYMPVPAVPAGIDAVKEINSPFHCLEYVRRSPHSHQINRLLCRKMGNHRLNNPVHLFMGFSHRQSPDCVTGKIEFCNLFCVLNPYVFIYRSLIDSKKELAAVDRIVQPVQTLHLRLTSAKPSGCPLHRCLHITAVRPAGRAFIKSHGNR